MIARHSVVDHNILNEGAIMNTREFFERKYASYPDLVCLNDFCLMLGGVSVKTALKTLDQGAIKFFRKGRRYLIPKICIIDYLSGLEYSPKDIKILSQTPGKRRRPGTGCLYQINEKLWEGKYSPRDAYGKRISKNVYAKTREACERKLMVLIAKMDQKILAQKALLIEDDE